MRIIMVILCVVLCGSCVQHSTTYLIPMGYKGQVTIFYNQEHGQEMKFEDGRRMLRIPPNGVLLTKFKDDKGITDHKYYFIDPKGNKKQLRAYSATDMKDDNLIAKNEVGVFFDGTTGRYGATVENLAYQWFVVADFKTLDSISTKEYEDAYKQRMKEAVGYDFMSAPLPK